MKIGSIKLPFASRALHDRLSKPTTFAPTRRINLCFHNSMDNQEKSKIDFAKEPISDLNIVDIKEKVEIEFLTEDDRIVLGDEQLINDDHLLVHVGNTEDRAQKVIQEIKDDLEKKMAEERRLLQETIEILRIEAKEFTSKIEDLEGVVHNLRQKNKCLLEELSDSKKVSQQFELKLKENQSGQQKPKDSNKVDKQKNARKAPNSVLKTTTLQSQKLRNKWSTAIPAVYHKEVSELEVDRPGYSMNEEFDQIMASLDFKDLEGEFDDEPSFCFQNPYKSNQKNVSAFSLTQRCRSDFTPANHTNEITPRLPGQSYFPPNNSSIKLKQRSKSPHFATDSTTMAEPRPYGSGDPNPHGHLKPCLYVNRNNNENSLFSASPAKILALHEPDTT